jgi:predicted NUDIX family phosphoesterase
MEVDENFKQIIPYLVFQHNDTYFMMHRRSDGFETRLHNKKTIGIGGHMRQEDMQKSSLFGWAEREFHEEIAYTGHLSITPLGIINDDSNDVGKVHIGLVLLLKGDSADISIKSELKSGKLIPLSECLAEKEDMESWSAYIIEYLQQTQQ